MTVTLINPIGNSCTCQACQASIDAKDPAWRWMGLVNGKRGFVFNCFGCGAKKMALISRSTPA